MQTDEQLLREYAESQGVDFDKLVAGASKHFQSSIIKRMTKELTDKELELLFVDDVENMKGVNT